MTGGEMATLEAERSLLEDGLLQNGHGWLYTGDGSVDINGMPVLKHITGNWKACFFIIGINKGSLNQPPAYIASINDHCDSSCTGSCNHCRLETPTQT